MWVKNEVFLGAGETVMAETCFEEWHWDLACAEIKHIHSDIGVLAVNVFYADSVNKHKYQSFSGIGTHHRNAHAVSAIQAIM